MANQPSKQTPQDILAALQAEAERQNKMLADLIEMINYLADDVVRMRRVIVMIGWLIIIAGAIGFAVWIVNLLSWYWGF